MYNSEAMNSQKVSSSRRRGVTEESAELTLKEDKELAEVLNLYASVVGRYLERDP
jgi:hypothetical protein